MQLTFSIATQRGALSTFAGALILTFSFVPLGLALWLSATSPVGLAIAGGVTEALPVPAVPPPWPLSLADKAARVVKGEFTAGSNFGNVLQLAGVDPALIKDLVRAAAPEVNLRMVRAGRPFTVYFDELARLLMFRYQFDRQTAIMIARGSGGWLARRVTVPYSLRPRYVHASIYGSLEGALASTWIGRRGAIDLAHKLADIFAWDIDFAADLRAGDTVDLMVEERYLENSRAGFGDILAADLRIAGRSYRAVRYQRGARTRGYYTPTGESLERAFLRSPVKYTRISSRFSYRRLHPVLNVVRPHLGVDFSAPAGTPVHATADGIVTYVGRNARAGNHLKIRHGGSYVSWYLHLSRFTPALRVGQRVKQGEIIGYVGRTGLATSDHLHYQLQRGGEFIDPLSIEFPSAAPLPAGDWRFFAEQRDQWMGLLRQAQRPTVLIAGGE